MLEDCRFCKGIHHTRRIISRLIVYGCFQASLFACCCLFPPGNSNGREDLPPQTIPGSGAIKQHQEDWNSDIILDNYWATQKEISQGRNSSDDFICPMLSPSSKWWSMGHHQIYRFDCSLSLSFFFLTLLPFNLYISKQAFPVYNLSRTLTNNVSRGILIVHTAYSIHNVYLTESIT